MFILSVAHQLLTYQLHFFAIQSTFCNSQDFFFLLLLNPFFLLYVCLIFLFLLFAQFLNLYFWLQILLIHFIFDANINGNTLKLIYYPLNNIYSSSYESKLKIKSIFHELYCLGSKLR